VAGIPGARYYAVNDRPVAVVPTADGGADCVVFDFATGELVPDRSYFGYVTPGSGKDVDALTEAAFEARLAAYRAEAGARATAQVLDWARRLGQAGRPAADLAAALGFATVAPADGGAVAADPPPPGYTSVIVRSDRRAARLQLRPAGRLLTRAVLDAAFGPGRELPIFPDSWDEGHVGYEPGRPGAPAGCEISVRFRRGAAFEISLRRGAPR
jgi:hypothetical protein